ncbi:hypothetical protein H6768_06910 [Candidatus Peribacteria bacterium]|nr:hypothetical protein [Candidatus Peribacteria bacterium]
MIVGVHEYKLANPLQENSQDIVSHAVLQQISEENTRTLYTDIDMTTLPEVLEYINSKKIQIRKPSRGEKVRILEFAHTNLLNFAYQEEMS